MKLLKRKQDKISKPDLTWTEKYWAGNALWNLIPLNLATILFAIGPADMSAGTKPADTVLINVATVIIPMLAWGHAIAAGINREEPSSMSWAKRRKMAKASRAYRHGMNGVYAQAVGDEVLIFEVTKEDRSMPHLWPLSLGYKAYEKSYPKRFNAIEQVDDAIEYMQTVREARELKNPRNASPDAIALTKALNS